MKKYREFKPIITKDTWSLPLQKDLYGIFYDIFLKDIEDTLKLPLENAKDTPLMAAIKKGKLTYRSGVFKGKFSSRVSKELKSYGAKWSIKEKGYLISRVSLPKEIFNQLEKIERGNIRIYNRISNIISNIPEKLNTYVKGLDFGKRADLLNDKMSEKFKETIGKQLGVQPKLDKVSRDRLKLEYNQQITKSIVNFTQDETERLRDVVAKEVFKGVSRSDLRDKLTKRFGISKTRAKFIARQETSLYVTKVKEIQYTSAGVMKYKWKAVGDSRTRPEHKKANGKVFYWDHNLNDNPVRNDKGLPVHPGEDFNCRCQAVPVIDKI